MGEDGPLYARPCREILGTKKRRDTFIAMKYYCMQYSIARDNMTIYMWQLNV